MTAQPPVQPGQVLSGPLFSEPMRVETVVAAGPEVWVVGLSGLQSERFRRVTLATADFQRLTVLSGRQPSTATAARFVSVCRRTPWV